MEESIKSLEEPKTIQKQKKIPKLKKKDYELVVCPKCKKPLRYFPFHNSFLCFDCNIECKINYNQTT